MKEPQLLITTLRMTTCIVCVFVFLLLHVCFCHVHVLLILSIVRSQLSETFGEEAWYKLKQAIKAVQSSQSISYSLEELYKAVENSCSHRMSAMLYENLKTECHLHVTRLLPDFNQYIIYCTSPSLPPSPPSLPPSLILSLLSYNTTCILVHFIPSIIFNTILFIFSDSIDDQAYLIVVDKKWRSFCHQMVN